jgi:carbon-monoxide dehydrogenase large subunit
VGKSIKRLEDPRLITGQAQYLEDMTVDGMADLVFVRSPYPHARITSLDAEAARNLPGVLAVVTAADLADIGPVPVGGNIKIPHHPALARDVVKYVGDAVAAVVAIDRATAQDAADQITVEYEPLPAVTDVFEALAGEAPLVHGEFENNVVMTVSKDVGDVDGEFAAAEHRLTVHVGHGRVAGLPIETRGGIAVYDPDGEQFTIWLSTQAAWLERGDLAKALGTTDDHVRVITPDVGGAFGAKMTLYRESIVIAALARMTERPVRWIATRMEDLLSSMHGREAFTDGEVAFDSDGRIRALKLRTVANLGSYLMKYSSGPPMRMLLFPTGCYTIDHLRSEVVGVFTHTGPMGPYRGAGRPEAAYFIERVVSDVAHALGMDQAEIRRRNFIPAEAFPYTNVADVTYDSGDYQMALDRALELVDYDRAIWEIAQRRELGEVVGLGIASCVEVSGGGGESGSVTLSPDGRVVAVTGTSPHGQGLVTSFAQIISDELGVDLHDIEVCYGDTAVGARGVGTMGSRSLHLGGSALRQAARQVREQLLVSAGEALEASTADLVVANGRITVAGATERSIALADAVRRAVAHDRGAADGGAGEDDGIHVALQYQGDGETFPFGTTVVVVAIDRDTGHPTIERYVSVDDCGEVVNPRLVEGQLIGGAVQGIGEALWEQVVYDADGQLLSSTLMEYAAPHAEWLPTFELERTTTPTPRNLLGAKGVGEAGTVHAPPAVTNAVMDALRPFGVEPLDLPLTAEKLWRVIHQGGRGIR